MASILLYHRNPVDSAVYKNLLKQKGHRVVDVSTSDDIVSELEKNDFEVILCELEGSAEQIRKLKIESPKSEIIILLDQDNDEDGMLAMKNGAYDFFCTVKPSDKISFLVERAAEKSRLRFDRLQISDLKEGLNDVLTNFKVPYQNGQLTQKTLPEAFHMLSYDVTNLKTDIATLKADGDSRAVALADLQSKVNENSDILSGMKKKRKAWSSIKEGFKGMIDYFKITKFWKWLAAGTGVAGVIKVLWEIFHGTFLK